MTAKVEPKKQEPAKPDRRSVLCRWTAFGSDHAKLPSQIQIGVKTVDTAIGSHSIIQIDQYLLSTLADEFRRAEHVQIIDLPADEEDGSVAGTLVYAAGEEIATSEGWEFEIYVPILKYRQQR